MGETAADTARELAALRAEADRLLEVAEARVRRVLDLPEQARAYAAANPSLTTALGVGAAALGTTVVLALWLRNYRRAQVARQRRRAQRAGSAIPAAAAGEAPAPPPSREPGLAERIAGAVAASATLALVDQFTRWLAERRAAGTSLAPSS